MVANIPRRPYITAEQYLAWEPEELHPAGLSEN